MTRWTVGIVVLFIAFYVEAGEVNEPVSIKEMAYRELQTAILRSDEMDLDQSALILTLGYADNCIARRVLVEIADYYLGSSSA